ncbi:hypothetical protein GIB67_011040 [Kingdonia uniflora]|uniref:Uncharacterized protein n=1 Tax=Kingdonia uniflora TaxID=39325 RepID=A0A7J7L6J5_9MAGN|nr:hypothetical protein GIB67_011040 [Kingdonia uniflora]
MASDNSSITEPLQIQHFSTPEKVSAEALKLNHPNALMFIGNCMWRKAPTTNQKGKNKKQRITTESEIELRDDGSSSPKSQTMSELEDIHVKTTTTNAKSKKRKQLTKQPSEDKEMLANDTTTIASEREPTNENPILQKHVNRKLFSVTEKSGTTVFDSMEDVEDINDDTSSDGSNNNVENNDKEEKT